MINVIVSGDEPISAESETDWTDVLVVPGTTVINFINLINEGDWPGFWRLTSGDEDTAAVRLPAGGGEPGERRAAITIPCPGFSGGKLQVRKGLLGGSVTGLWAYGMK
jgi:hypothetical protein